MAATQAAGSCRKMKLPEWEACDAKQELQQKRLSPCNLPTPASSWLWRVQVGTQRSATCVDHVLCGRAAGFEQSTVGDTFITANEVRQVRGGFDKGNKKKQEALLLDVALSNAVWYDRSLRLVILCPALNFS